MVHRCEGNRRTYNHLCINVMDKHEGPLRCLPLSRPFQFFPPCHQQESPSLRSWGLVESKSYNNTYSKYLHDEMSLRIVYQQICVVHVPVD